MLKSLFEEYGLQPVVLLSHPHFYNDQPLERALKQLEIANALEIKEVNTLGFWGYREFPEQLLTEEEFKSENQIFVSRYKTIANKAKRLGITITLKPHTGNTATPAHIRATLDEINSPYVKACYDPGNVSYYEGLSPEVDFSKIVSDIVSFVAKDHIGSIRNFNFPIPGEGDVPFLTMFKALHKVGFNGPILVEKLDGKGELCSADELDHRILRARLNLEQLIQEAGFLY